MKKTVATVMFTLLLVANSISVFASTDTSSNLQDINVMITSPENIESRPVFEGNIQFTVTNNTDHELTNIACFLMILDKGRGQTYPVDEFGQDAYQTREIAAIEARETQTFTIPVKITYVGDFKFNIIAIHYGNDDVYTSNTLSVHMIENSSMNKTVVMIVAALVPILTLFVSVIVVKGKKKKK